MAYIERDGYVREWCPKRKKKIYQHVRIWEKHYGPVPKGYEVHHKNHLRDDNDIKNLDLKKKGIHQVETWARYRALKNEI